MAKKNKGIKRYQVTTLKTKAKKPQEDIEKQCHTSFEKLCSLFREAGILYPEFVR